MILQYFAVHKIARITFRTANISYSNVDCSDIEQLEKWNLHRPRLFRASAEKAEQVSFY